MTPIHFGMNLSMMRVHPAQLCEVVPHFSRHRQFIEVVKLLREEYEIFYFVEAGALYSDV